MQIINNFFLVIELILLAIIGLCIAILIIREILIYLMHFFIMVKDSLNLNIYLLKIHRSCLKSSSINFKNI